jgi:hypothetical protein
MEDIRSRQASYGRLESLIILETGLQNLAQ